MEKLFGFALFLLSSIPAFAQSSDTFAVVEEETIVIEMKNSLAEIQVPADTYVLEVIDAQGIVQFQKPARDFISIDTSP